MLLTQWISGRLVHIYMLQHFFDFLKKPAFSGSRTIRSVGIDRFEFTVFRSDAIMYYHFRGLRVYEKTQDVWPHLCF